MFRANIYSIEKLTPAVREGVHDGIGMVAAYMGERVVVHECIVQLPQTVEGTVDYRRVGFGKLDPLTELHLMAVPLEPGPNDRGGVAALNAGHPFVDISILNTHLIRSQTAHEVAHSFGYVLPDAEQSDMLSPEHCQDNNCLMFEIMSVVPDTPPRSPDNDSAIQLKFKPILHRQAKQQPKAKRASNIRLMSQFDFCEPCKSDLRVYADRQLDGIRRQRLGLAVADQILTK